MTKGKLRNKIGLLVKAMDGRVTDHHRFLLKMHLEHLESISIQINELDEEIYQKLEPFEKEFRLIRTHPAISEITGASVIAEIGVDMTQFPDEHHLSSWAAISPGNNGSAGKRKSGRTRRGNNYLKTTLVEAAWVASRTNDTFLSARYYNIAQACVEVREQQSQLVIKSLRTYIVSCPQVSHTKKSELKLLETESLRCGSVP